MPKRKATSKSTTSKQMDLDSDELSVGDDRPWRSKSAKNRKTEESKLQEGQRKMKERKKAADVPSDSSDSDVLSISPENMKKIRREFLPPKDKQKKLDFLIRRATLNGIKLPSELMRKLQRVQQPSLDPSALPPSVEFLEDFFKVEVKRERISHENDKKNPGRGRYSRMQNSRETHRSVTGKQFIQRRCISRKMHKSGRKIYTVQYETSFMLVSDEEENAETGSNSKEGRTVVDKKNKTYPKSGQNPRGRNSRRGRRGGKN